MNAKTNPIWLALVLCLAWAFLYSSAYAEVIELEGTVKAVDADARTISIERKTAKGTKTLDLEVNKKAGDLSSVKVGDEISFSYDPDLELVTKLGGGEPPADKAAGGATACRLRIVMGETGDTTVQVEPIEVASEGGKNERKNLGDGVWQLTNYFASAKDLKLFESALGKPLNAEINGSKKTLVLAPKKSPGFDNPAAQCVYPFRLRVPFEIELDVSTTAKEGWPFIQIYAMPRGSDMERPVFNFRTKSALKEGMVFNAWSSKMGVKEGSNLVEETPIDLKSKWEKSFRLPIPNIKSNDVYALTIGSVGPPADKTFIYRIAVKGFPSPLLGLSLDQKGDVIFVNKSLPETLAAKAGAKVGDVIIGVNGTKPSSVTNAVDLMAKTGFGETCEIAIKRGNDDIRLVLKPEWDE